MNFGNERRPDGRGKHRNSRGRPLGIISLSVAVKRRAILKLGSVYGVVRARWSWADLSVEVAKALQVSNPDALVDRASMIQAFINPRRGDGPQPGDDRVAELAARYPFRPLQITREMERALARTAQYRSVGAKP